MLVEFQEPRLLSRHALVDQLAGSSIVLGVTWIMLDNMSQVEIRQAVLLNDGRAKLEASGNVTLANVRHIADTGVDYISVGALTHSVRNFDVSLIVSKVS